MFRPSRPMLIALLVALLVGGLGGAWWLNIRGFSLKGGERPVTLYFLDAMGMYVVPVDVRLALPGSRELALETALNAVGSAPAGLMSPMSSGSMVKVDSLHDGRAEISVRLGGIAPGGGGEQLLASAMVRTAGSVEGVQEVLLKLLDSNGHVLPSEHMDLSQPLSPTDPGMENLYLGGEGLAVTIYYRLPRTSYLVPVRVPLPKGREGEPLVGSFELLMAGPPAELSSFLTTSVEPKTELRWNGTAGNVAQLLWKNAPAATPSPLTLRALALTLTESGQLKGIQLKREGLPLTGLSGSFDLNRPVSRPPSVNPENETR